MKSILLAIFAISLATAAFPGSLLFGQVHKRQATTEPPEATVGPTEPSNPRLVSANTCRCFKDVSNAIVGCLPDEHGEPMAFMNGMLCYCFDEEIEIPDTCVIPTGPSNVTEICSWTWWLQYFSVLALDSLNVSQFASIEGRIAAKNNIWLNNFRVNYAPSGLAEGVNETIDTDCDELDEYENSWRFSCVAGQNLSLTSGRIYSGDVIYGNVLTATGLNLSSNCQSIKNETILDFDFAKMEILRLANGLADLPATGQYSISGGVLTLTAPSQLEPNALIVWNVLLSDLLNINSLSFNGFPEADMVKALVFNLIVPSGMQIPSGFNFQLPDSWNFEELAEHGYANKIIFNFGELNATLSVSTSSPSAVRSFVGTVLAPYISLNTGSSRVRIVGQAFCHSFSGSYLIVESHPTNYCLQNILDEFQTTTFAPTATATVPATATLPARR